MDIRSYRDTPKRGETDAKWCAYVVASNGHVIGNSTCGHETEAEARNALLLVELAETIEKFHAVKGIRAWAAEENVETKRKAREIVAELRGEKP